MSSHEVLNGFIETKEYRRFAEFCDACQRHQYIGLCYGPPGVGKTLSARHYAQWDAIAQYRSPAIRERQNLPSVVWRERRVVFYTAPVSCSAMRLRSTIVESCLDFEAFVARMLDDERVWEMESGLWTKLLIIDEADRLKTIGLEQVRDVYDTSRHGLVLIGMPGMEKRLSRYPQLYSRVGFVHRFNQLTVDEVRFIFNHKWESLGVERTLTPDNFTDEEALATAIRVTAGNFRLLDRLLAQIERVLEINEMRTVTKEVVEAARESLVIGVM